MMIGALGNIPFQTSGDQTLLLSGLRWDSGMRYAEHARHNETSMLEYVGKDPDEINFDIKLSAFLGINPTLMMDRLRTLHNDRKAVKFALGTMPIPGLWVLTRMECAMEYFHKDGTLLSVDVSLTLREYVEQVSMPVISSRISFTDRMSSASSNTSASTVTPQPAPENNRKPVVPSTTKPVSISKTPVTKPTVTAETVANVSNIIKNTAKAAVVIGTTIVNKVSSAVSSLNIVQTIKNAFSTTSYTTKKETPAKPVVVKPSQNKNVKPMLK